MKQTQPQSVAQKVMQAEMNQDAGKDLQPSMPIDYNLGHLTLSKTIMEYIDAHSALLGPLKPLGDQVFGTTYLDRQGIFSYKLKIKRIILRIKTDLNEDDTTEHHVLRVIQTYLNAYIESCYMGYRGKLATEIRRTYKMEQETPERRRWTL